MARPLRLEFPDALYHVTSRGNEHRPIVKSDRDREAFLGFLEKAAKRFRWSVTGYVLMTNHFHLVIQTPEANLSRGMHWLNGSYAGWFNRVHNRSGHLFQGRFGALLIEKESHLTEVLRYVVLNPVRAKMVDRPEEYCWSSYRATVGLDPAPAWLDLDSVLATFHRDREPAQAYYREFVLSKVESTERLWDQVTNGMYLGTEEWAKTIRAEVESKPRSTDHPLSQRAVGRPKMHTIVAAVAKAAGETPDTIRSRKGGVLRRL
ncbi:MAG: putative transposase, partial [Acidobacteria bacterium]|nr:putative transposase [Acidobacteriota bacterium]